MLYSRLGFVCVADDGVFGGDGRYEDWCDDDGDGDVV